MGFLLPLFFFCLCCWSHFAITAMLQHHVNSQKKNLALTKWKRLKTITNCLTWKDPKKRAIWRIWFTWKRNKAALLTATSFQVRLRHNNPNAQVHRRSKRMNFGASWVPVCIFSAAFMIHETTSFGQSKIFNNSSSSLK